MSEQRTPDDKCFSYISLEKATTPTPGLLKCIKDAWYAVHPKRGIVVFQKRSVQHNQNRDVVEHLIPRLYPWAEARQIPYVYLPIDPQDYCGH